jgi:hypothetical protein
VIGAGLSVIRFFIDPLEKLAPKTENTVSASPFCAKATVIGAGLSVTRFFKDPFEKLAPNT